LRRPSRALSTPHRCVGESGQTNDATDFETVEESEAGGVIVFGHNIKPLDTLAEQLIERGLMVVRAYGAVSQQQRVEAERLFQNRTRATGTVGCW
jgi:hypothetical protein